MRPRLATRASRLLLKAAKTKTSKTAIASRPAVKLVALFTPEANPECLPSTEFMAVDVSGAITTLIPKPTTTTAGKSVVQ